ncbi:MAG: Hsp20/alpha crystallin family protein [Thermodesulfobacteriota bacterium]
MNWSHLAGPLGWSPWREMDRLHAEVERLFERSRAAANDSYAPGHPPVNLWSGDDEVVISAELPGVDADKIDISVVDDTVTLSGERSANGIPEAAVFRHRERGHGRFSRTFRLPFRIDATAVDARYANGVLEVTLPRAADDKPRKIPVLAA